MSDANFRLEQLAIEAARERGFNFPRPISGRQLSAPIVHWELVAAAEQGKEVCVLLDIHGEVLNVEWRPVQASQSLPWWKKMLGY